MPATISPKDPCTKWTKRIKIPLKILYFFTVRCIYHSRSLVKLVVSFCNILLSLCQRMTAHKHAAAVRQLKPFFVQALPIH